MKRRVVFISLFLALAGGLVWLLVALHPGEPVYQGKRLSEWLDGYSPMGGSTNTWEQADAAVGQAGAEAIPTLLRMLRARDTSIKLKVVELLQKQHFVKIPFTPAARLHFEAAMGFRRLGTNAGGAVPGLIKVYARHVSDSSRTATVMALDDVAAGGVPLVAQGLGSRDAAVREMLAGVLARIHAPPSAVVPLLSNCLGDGSAAVRSTAAAGLARFGPDAAAAVPALLKARQDSDRQVRSAAEYALERIEPGAGREMRGE